MLRSTTASWYGAKAYWTHQIDLQKVHWEPDDPESSSILKTENWTTVKISMYRSDRKSVRAGIIVKDLFAPANHRTAIDPKNSETGCPEDAGVSRPIRLRKRDVDVFIIEKRYLNDTRARDFNWGNKSLNPFPALFLPPCDVSGSTFSRTVC